MRVLKAPRTHLRGLKNSILFQNNGLDFCASIRRHERRHKLLWAVERQKRRKMSGPDDAIRQKTWGYRKKKIRPSERHSI